MQETATTTTLKMHHGEHPAEGAGGAAARELRSAVAPPAAAAPPRRPPERALLAAVDAHLLQLVLPAVVRQQLPPALLPEATKKWTKMTTTSFTRMMMKRVSASAMFGCVSYKTVWHKAHTVPLLFFVFPFLLLPSAFLLIRDGACLSPPSAKEPFDPAVLLPVACCLLLGVCCLLLGV